LAKRSIIRYGDRTTHGGTVVSADPTLDIYGKDVARVGDKVVCPRCKGTFPIVTGAQDVWSGQNIARQDDMTSCGAKLIASQSTATIDDGSEVAASVAAAPAPLSQVAEATPGDEETHAIRFQALDPDTGAPASNCIYILTRENGAQHGGITDREGFTEVIETTRPEQIGVHFMFKSPKGGSIDREDLAA
jgi:uncharacterized Zn-binding protein involved in type VI secretion